MDGLRLEPGQVLDEAWTQAALALDRPARDRLFERADALRDEAADVAYACYCVFHDVLDDERVAWLLQQMRRADPVLEPTVRRAAGASPGSDLWFHGQVRMAHFERAAGRVDAAIAIIADLARDVTGARLGVVYAKLALLLGQTGRFVECLLVSRRAVALLAASPLRHDLARARLVLANRYVDFGDWERYDEECVALDATIDELPDAARRHVEEQRVVLEWSVALARGEIERALEFTDQMHKAMPHHGAVLDSVRTFLLVRLGRADEAPELTAPPPGQELRFATAHAAHVVAREPAATAQAHLERYFDEVDRSLAPPGERLDLLRQLLGILRERPGFEPHAKRTCDLAAAAVLERLGEVHRFARDPEPLIEPTKQDRRELGRLEARFFTQHEALKQAVVRLFAADATLHRDWYHGGGVLSLCAWCGRSRHSDGTWVPIGSLLPEDGGLHISHGLCPDCQTDEFVT